ncbi:MAG TPA: hypothetical protein VGD56_11505, partial [Gemmatirosa sp.]
SARATRWRRGAPRRARAPDAGSGAATGGEEGRGEARALDTAGRQAGDGATRAKFAPLGGGATRAKYS